MCNSVYNAHYTQMQVLRGAMRHELVRNLRKEKHMTLVAMSQITGYTPSFLSQIERGLKTPSLDALRRISDCLDVSILSFLEERSGQDDQGASPDCAPYSVVRGPKRHRFQVEEKGAVYELVTPQTADNFQKFSMYGMYASIDPHSSTNEFPISHFYEECCFVLSGRMTALVEGENIILEPGDSLYIESNVVHNYINNEDEPLVILNFQAK